MIDDQVVLLRAPDGPLAVHLGPFAQSQSAQGYTGFSVHRNVLLAAGFSHWLKQKGVPLRRVGREDLSRYLRDRARRLRPYQGDVGALRHLLDFLRHEGVVAAEKTAAGHMTPAERCAHAYAQYLRDTRALASATIVNYVPFIREFLTNRFGTGPVKLTGLHARDVVRYVQCQAPQLHLKRAKLLTPRCALSYVTCAITER